VTSTPLPGPRPEDDVWHCYRHPDRESGVRCRRCERPICPACMITAPVGFQCPSCVRGGPAVRPLRSLRRDPWVTRVIVGVCVAVFLPSLGQGASLGRGAGDLVENLALSAPDVATGEWWRLVTSGFLHLGLLHVGFNMLILYQLGQLLEPALGRWRFAALYATALLGGSFGALLVSPDALTAGASGAVYGLMGAAVVGLRRRGIDPMQSGIGGLLVVNLLLTFVIPGISIGGHLGGLAAGAVGGAVLFGTEDDHRPVGVAGCLAVAAALFLASLYVASNPLVG
jgi:membrane associated rhomboid family serine protease